MKRSRKKYLRRCQEMCGGCAWRPGTDAFEARLGRPRDPRDADLKEAIDRCNASGGSVPFCCHEYGQDQDGALVVPEDRQKLCVGWVNWMRARNWAPAVSP